MSCQRQWNGMRECDIVPHPDYPNEESFCTVCDRRFYNRSSGPAAGASFGGALLRAIALAFGVLLLLQAFLSSGQSEAPTQPAQSAITQRN